MKIKIYTVGGTIDKVYFDKLSDYEVGESVVTQMLKDANVQFDFEIEPVMRKDSLDMSDEDRQILFEKISADKTEHVLITHGTDTVIQSALILQQIKDKVIVMTGAMQPARFKDSDATFNIGFALGAMQVLKHGVYIAINGKIFDPSKANKVRTLNIFEHKEN